MGCPPTFEAFKTKEEICEAMKKIGKDTDIPDYPKHLEIVCRPEDIVKLAKALKRVCEPKE